MTTKILALTDALGNPADFCLLPGQAHDLRGVPELIEGLHADYVLADSAFDADWLRKSLSKQGISPVIPPRKNRKVQFHYDTDLYKTRNIVERMFNRLKDWRQLSLRTFRCSETFLAAAHIAATVIWYL